MKGNRENRNQLTFNSRLQSTIQISKLDYKSEDLIKFLITD